MNQNNIRNLKLPNLNLKNINSGGPTYSAYYITATLTKVSLLVSAFSLSNIRQVNQFIFNS